MGPMWNAALTSSQSCAHSHPWHCFSPGDQTQQPQKLNTVQHPQIQPEFWGSPSSLPTAELQTLSCQRGWILFKSSSFADGNNQTQPVLPTTAQPQHPVRSRFRSTLNLVYGYKNNTCQCQVLRKEQLFSWPHFLLPEYLRHAKESHVARDE